MLGRVDERCDQFEADWKDGGRPRIEDYLGAAGGAERSALLRELVRVELEYRYCHGESPTPDEYHRRFPGDGELIDSGFASIEEGVARVAGDALDEDQVPAVWRPGDHILGFYEVRGILGEGGMGTVYRVHHRGWGLDLAVKSPRPEYFQTEQQRTTFERECETWVNLGLHPYVANCFYVRRLGGIPRIFAESVEGGSLRDWIGNPQGRPGRLYQDGPDMALECILDIALQVVWGLHHAHEQGVVHQDVKPANVLMTHEGVAKVTDFGLARARAVTGEAAARNPVQSILVSVGGMTPAYCSPEQARGQLLSRKTDLWSWAVSVLHMFTVRVTWSDGPGAGEALERYLATAPGNEHMPQIPRGLADLLRRCFRHDLGERPRTAAEVADALRDVYREATGRAYPRPVPQPVELLADGLNNRALSLLDLGKHKEAKQVWEKALQLHVDHPESVYNRGLWEWRDVQATEAQFLQRMTKTCASHAESWLPHYLLAQVHLERGDCEAALASLGRIDEADSATDEVASLIAQARNQLPHSNRLLRTFEGHTGEVKSVCLSVDGCYALSGSDDTTAKLWEVASGRCLRTFEGHTGPVLAVCLSADGRYALSGGGVDWSKGSAVTPDCTVRLWDVETGRCLRTCEGHTQAVNSVCLSADGRYALSGSGRPGFPENDPTIRDCSVRL
jgi:serine/threonine protein kinase